MESVKTQYVNSGKPIVLGEDTRLDDTFVLDGLVDVHSFVGNPFGEVVLGVSPFMENVECDSPLIQVGLEEVSPQPRLFV